MIGKPFFQGQVIFVKHLPIEGVRSRKFAGFLAFEPVSPGASALRPVVRFDGLSPALAIGAKEELIRSAEQMLRSWCASTNLPAHAWRQADTRLTEYGFEVQFAQYIH